MAFTRVTGAGGVTDPSVLAQFLSRAYATGFGATALQKARSSGLSDSQIKSALQGAGLQIGPKAALSLGANPTMHQYTQPGSYGFGAGALAKAQAAGMTNAQIRSNLADSGLTIGDKAAQVLNVNPGFTYAGYAPGIDPSYTGNAGGKYPARPQLAPRGYGIDGRFGSKFGYSPTLYIAGGENDYDALNTVFGLNYDGGPDIGGGYYDPDFNRINYVPPAHDPYRPFGGYSNGYNPNTMQVSGYQTPQTALMPTINSAIPGGAKVSSVANAGASLRSRKGLGAGGTAGGGATMQTKSINI